MPRLPPATCPAPYVVILDGLMDLEERGGITRTAELVAVTTPTRSAVEAA